MQLFFTSDINESDQQYCFDKVESRHIVKVLRKNIGDNIWISNGKGLLCTAVILIPDEKKCLVQIVGSEIKPTGRPYKLHVAIAPTKLNDRFEWFLEKATEIGIDTITPIICDRSERKVLKHDRMHKIIIAAAKQSLKFHIPELHQPIPFKNFLKQSTSDQLFIAHCAASMRKPLKKLIIPNSNITVVIGPEGDFTPNEIQQSLEHQFIPVSLGESRLRTETAGLVAVHSVAFANEIY